MSVLKKVLDFILDLLILGLSAFLASLAFPSKYIEDGIPFLAFFYLIPVFYVIWRSKWSTVWLYGAFYGCTGLTRINFNGTKAQWSAISKGWYWRENVPATQVICTDGTIES